MGPSAVRVAGLEARLEELGHTGEDAGNVSVADGNGPVYVFHSDSGSDVLFQNGFA